MPAASRRSRLLRAGPSRARLLRTGLAVVALGASAALVACDGTAPDPSPPEPSPSASPVDAAPTAAPEPHETDLPAGFDERPDTSAAPDASLTAAERAALLRVPATASPRADACAAADVEVRLWGYDVAAGSRFSTLRVTNLGAAACTVAGYPGIGARGEWGSAFPLIAEQEAGEAPADVVLDPGASAAAPIRWTGELAGADAEWASMLVVQLAQEQEAVAVEPVVRADSMLGGDSGPPHDARVDIGMRTTVRVGAFAPAG